MKITKISYFLLGLALCITLHTACTGNTSPDETNPAKPTTLASATKLINDRCPEVVDPETRLDSVRLSRENQLIYYYTLPNKGSSSINPNAFNAFLLTGIIENVRLNPDLRIHRDSSIIFIFNYRDRYGELITEFSVGPERYR